LLPPFSHQALICANSKNREDAENFLIDASGLLKNIDIDDVEIWGPVSDVIEKKSDYYYFNLYLQSSERASLHQIISTFNENVGSIKLSTKVRWYLDIDPIV
jgi:primosomal protein N' (replication factor Y)